MSATATLISNVRDFLAKLVNADGTTNKLLVTPAAAGTRIKSLMASSDDTVARVLQLVKTVGGTDYILGEVSVPIGAGTDGATPAVNLLSQSSMPGLQTDGVSYFLDISTGTTFNVRTKVAVTAAKTIYLMGEGGDFT